MFEKASRQAIRFNGGAKGQLSVEDLWSLPLQSTRSASLDSIARDLHRELKDAETESFVSPQSNADTITQLKFDIVKHIINVRVQENDEKLRKKQAAAQKDRIDQIIADKKDKALLDMSIDDLEKMKNDL